MKMKNYVNYMQEKKRSIFFHVAQCSSSDNVVKDVSLYLFNIFSFIPAPEFPLLPRLESGYHPQSADCLTRSVLSD